MIQIFFCADLSIYQFISSTFLVGFSTFLNHFFCLFGKYPQGDILKERNRENVGVILIIGRRL